ncbi:hypothetical protein ABBQ38_003311 [Trebouxia sp. C0009 RCD-2024]
MTQAFKLTLAVLPGLPTWQPPPCKSSPYTNMKAASALQRTHGRTRHQHHEARCLVIKAAQAGSIGEVPSITLLDPVLQRQWDHSANAYLGTIDIKPDSTKQVRWICDQCPDGQLHSWSAMVRSRTNGSGCPQCGGRKVCKHNSLASKASLVAAQWDYEANDGTPDDVLAESGQLVRWKCDVCGFKWTSTPKARVSKRMCGCPQCAAAKKEMKNNTKG